MISTQGKTSPYLCNSYSAVHMGKYVIKLLKLSMCLELLLSWETRDIFSISIVHVGFKSFAAFPHKEEAVHSDSDAGRSACGCPSPSSKEVQ